MLVVENVQPGSVAEALGLEPGAKLLSVNGKVLSDFLDWEYLIADDTFTLLVQIEGDEVVEIKVDRSAGLPMGVSLEPPQVITCNNRCDFCFVKGNPKGLRRALYVKDDDYRLSFRYGNFVTLTNLGEADVHRIVEYHLSPLYVSVHATKPEVRRRLLNNPNAPDVISQLEDFGKHGIVFHTQVVLQPGINDGVELERTIGDLYGLGEVVLSVSVVPVGLTSRNQKPYIRMPTEVECSDAVDKVDALAAKAYAERGKFWVYGSDELYLRAGVTLPEADRFDDFEQLENGVGVVRYFQKQIGGFETDLNGKRIGVATGTAMAPLFPEILSELSSRTGAEFELLVLENDLFGASVTTAGLLPGRAFAEAGKSRGELDLLLIPAESLNDDSTFLDDMTFSELQDCCTAELVASHWIVDSLERVP